MAKAKAKPGMTDAERHARFVAMAREVEATNSAKAFDDAFRKVAASPPTKSKAAPL